MASAASSEPNTFQIVLLHKGLAETRRIVKTMILIKISLPGPRNLSIISSGISLMAHGSMKENTLSAIGHGQFMNFPLIKVKRINQSFLSVSNMSEKEMPKSKIKFRSIIDRIISS